MLLREQAITILKQFTNKEGKIILSFSNPFPLLPKHIDDLFFLESEIDIRKISLINTVKYTLKKYYTDVIIYNLTTKIIEFTTGHIDYYGLIDDLNSLQKNFDDKYNNNFPLNAIEEMNEIKELEYLLIELAQKLLLVKESIDSELIKMGIENNKKIIKE